MVSVEATVLNKLGLHARPSALLAKTAAVYASSITITEGSRTVDCKSILGLMTMGLGCGARIVLTAEGRDEKEALEHIASLFRDRFGEAE